MPQKLKVPAAQGDKDTEVTLDVKTARRMLAWLNAAADPKISCGRQRCLRICTWSTESVGFLRDSRRRTRNTRRTRRTRRMPQRSMQLKFDNFARASGGLLVRSQRPLPNHGTVSLLTLPSY